MLRNSVQSSDYDTRAFFSRIPFQRWWQQRRGVILSDYIGDALRVLDAGCGSTQLLNRFPQNVGMDYGLRKVRFMRRADDQPSSDSIASRSDSIRKGLAR